MDSDILIGQIRVNKSSAAEVTRDLVTTLHEFSEKHPGSIFVGVESASEMFGARISSSRRIDRVAANRDIFDPPEWLPGE